MKLLFDQNISFRIVKRISDLVPDCVHVKELGLVNATDHEIWSYAKAYNYAIVTFDTDFYNISLFKGNPPKVIWLRTGNLTTQHVEELIRSKFETIREFCNSQAHAELGCLICEG